MCQTLPASPTTQKKSVPHLRDQRNQRFKKNPVTPAHNPKLNT
jgi:hypothetical protein